MSSQLWDTVLLRYCYNLYCQIKPKKFLSTSAKCYSKKQYRMRNKFTFRDDLKKVTVENSKYNTESPYLFSEQYENIKENEHSNFTAHEYVSADLLSPSENKIQRKITHRLPEETKSKKPYLAYKGEILFGVHPVYLALLQKKRIFYNLFTRKDIDPSTEDTSRKGEIIQLARLLNIPISFIDSRGFKILAPGTVHQGICLDAGFLPLPVWNEDKCIVNTCENGPLWLILHEILDPMNVGAIIRSAYYFGVNKLFTVRGNSCKLSPTVSKASSGTLEVMDIYQIGNLEEFVMNRKKSGWSVVSTLAYSSEAEMVKPLVSVDQFKSSRPTVLILGNEGKGIPGNILKLCDSLISINPRQVLPKGVDSLNVSVAAGVLLYALSNSKSNR